MENQSEFEYQTSTLQAPPETMKPPLTDAEIQAKHKKSMKLGLIAGGVGVFLLLLILIVVSQPPVVPEAPTPTPTAIPTKAPSELQKSLKTVEEAVERANPDRPIIEMPPVDMQVSF